MAKSTPKNLVVSAYTELLTRYLTHNTFYTGRSKSDPDTECAIYDTEQDFDTIRFSLSPDFAVFSAEMSGDCNKTHYEPSTL